MNKFKTVMTIIAFSIVFVIWYLSSLKVNKLFIPNPLDVANDFKIMIHNGQLKLAIFYTLKRVSIASLLAGMISLPFGLLVYNIWIVKYTINPIVNILRYIPVTAFYPLLIMWLGINEEMKVVFLTVAISLYMIPSVILALDEINQDLIDTGKTIGMGKFKIIRMIQLPAIAPSVINSFIVSYSIGFNYIPIVETINAKYGLGYIMQQSTARGRTDLVFMSMITIMVISIIFNISATTLVKIIFKWRYVNDSAE